MKSRLIIPAMILMAMLLLTSCKTCNCGYQPPKAKVNSTWIKR
jgi:hypothetical protein